MVGMSMAGLRAVQHPQSSGRIDRSAQAHQQGAAATRRLPLGPTLNMCILRDQFLVRQLI